MGTKISTNYLAAPQMLRVQDQKPALTHGGDSVSGAWFNRTLNTIVDNTITGASLANDTIILPAGTYHIEADSSFYKPSRVQIRIQNITDGTTLLESPTYYAESSTVVGVIPRLSGRISINESKQLRLQYRVQSAYSPNGLGVSNDWGTGIFSDVSVYKIG